MSNSESLSSHPSLSEIQTILPSYEEAVQASVNVLSVEIANYDRAVADQRRAYDGAEDSVVEREAQRVAAALRKVGDSCSDPVVRDKWHLQAEVFSKASKVRRKVIIKNMKKGALGLLHFSSIFIRPALCVAAWALHMSGDIVDGIGDAFSIPGREQAMNTRTPKQQAKKAGLGLIHLPCTVIRPSLNVAAWTLRTSGDIIEGISDALLVRNRKRVMSSRSSK